MLDSILNLVVDTPEYLLYFIVALGILVFVHELGHFLVAKKAGIRVERFSLGFPPKMIGIQVGETEYCLSWIPFGGYVKVAGMADIGSDSGSGEEWEFPSKPIWVRMAVIFAGPLMNFIFAFFAFLFIFLHVGVETSGDTVVSVDRESYWDTAGFQDKDRVLSVDGEPVGNWFELIYALEKAGEDGALVEVERDGRPFTLDLPSPGFGVGLTPMAPPIVGSLEPGMPAERAGLIPGDRITRVAGEPVRSWSEMSALIRQHPGQSVQIVWNRPAEATPPTANSGTTGRQMSAHIVPVERHRGDETIGLIGIGLHTARVPVGGMYATEMAFRSVFRSSWLILDFLGQLFQGERSTDELGGPLRIAQMAQRTAEQGFPEFVGFLALLSVNLAVLNLLPIPVLDGGHLFFLTLEAIMRRPLSVRQRELSQQIGLAIMLCIMVLVTFNDLNQIVFHRIADFFQ